MTYLIVSYAAVAAYFGVIATMTVHEDSHGVENYWFRAPLFIVVTASLWPLILILALINNIRNK